MKKIWIFCILFILSVMNVYAEEKKSILQKSRDFFKSALSIDINQEQLTPKEKCISETWINIEDDSVLEYLSVPDRQKFSLCMSRALIDVDDEEDYLTEAELIEFSIDKETDKYIKNYALSDKDILTRKKQIKASKWELLVAEDRDRLMGVEQWIDCRGMLYDQKKDVYTCVVDMVYYEYTIMLNHQSFSWTSEIKWWLMVWKKAVVNWIFSVSNDLLDTVWVWYKSLNDFPDLPYGEKKESMKMDEQWNTLYREVSYDIDYKKYFSPDNIHGFLNSIVLWILWFLILWFLIQRIVWIWWEDTRSFVLKISVILGVIFWIWFLYAWGQNILSAISYHLWESVNQLESWGAIQSVINFETTQKWYTVIYGNIFYYIVFLINTVLLWIIWLYVSVRDIFFQILLALVFLWAIFLLITANYKYDFFKSKGFKNKTLKFWVQWFYYILACFLTFYSLLIAVILLWVLFSSIRLNGVDQPLIYYIQDLWWVSFLYFSFVIIILFFWLKKLIKAYYSLVESFFSWVFFGHLDGSKEFGLDDFSKTVSWFSKEAKMEFNDLMKNNKIVAKSREYVDNTRTKASEKLKNNRTIQSMSEIVEDVWESVRWKMRPIKNVWKLWLKVATLWAISSRWDVWKVVWNWILWAVWMKYWAVTEKGMVIEQDKIKQDIMEVEKEIQSLDPSDIRNSKRIRKLKDYKIHLEDSVVNKQREINKKHGIVKEERHIDAVMQVNEKLNEKMFWVDPMMYDKTFAQEVVNELKVFNESTNELHDSEMKSMWLWNFRKMYKKAVGLELKESIDDSDKKVLQDIYSHLNITDKKTFWNSMEDLQKKLSLIKSKRKIIVNDDFKNKKIIELESDMEDLENELDEKICNELDIKKKIVEKEIQELKKEKEEIQKENMQVYKNQQEEIKNKSDKKYFIDLWKL